VDNKDYNIRITVDVKNLHKVQEYIRQLHEELKYYRLLIEILDPDLIINKN